MNRYVFRLFIASFSFLVVSCGSTSEQIEGVKTEQVGVEKLDAREEIKGKLDVYDSIARSTKYNVDDLSKYLMTKVNDPRFEFLTSEQIIASARGKNEEDRLPIYDSLRNLDFAVIFADTNIAIYKRSNSNILYKKSAQSLALSAIKYHERVLFINKKTKEINKNVATIQKKIASLNEKFEKEGRLSPEDTEYKKSLEVVAYKFNSLNNQFAAEKEEYKKIIKAMENEKVKLEGRQFYEVTGFDKSLTIDIFQKGAVNAREEFVDDFTAEKKYDFASVEMIAVEKYPDVKTLIINGYGIGDRLYEEALHKRADKIADNLVKDTLDFRYNTSKRERNLVVTSLYDNLVIAIFTQIELAYNVIYINDMSIQNLDEEMKAKRNTLHKIEKAKDSEENELKIYNGKLELIELGYKMSKFKADRAAAIRALYFYAGFEPFNPQLLEKPVREVAKDLKVAFNSDVISSLSKVQAPQEEKAGVDLKVNEWAKKDGWLEVLVDGKSSEVGTLPPPPPPASNASGPLLDLTKLPNKSIGSAGEAYNSAQNDRTTMQLGAYSNIENANAHWARVSAAYPELNKYAPEIEDVSVNGRTLHRLIVRSSDGGLVNVCNLIKADGIECILR